jgi:Acyl-CoA reductase (LuxC).
MMDVLENKIKYLIGNEDIIKGAADTPALPMFSNEAVGFLSELSKELLAIPSIREHLDVMSYAYWIRKASLEQARKEFVRDDVTRIGRGVAFHIAPSNVPVNFAVSMTSSLLAGNICIIRVSNKEFEEVDIICSAIKRIFQKPEFAEMNRYICIVRYEHSDEITAYFSSICDIRIIWGGEQDY